MTGAQDMQDVPGWALDRAGELSGYKSRRRSGHSWWWTWEGTIAFARYIAAHEEPPADPLYEALKAVVELGRYDTREQTELLRAELAQRGLQITSLASDPNHGR